MLSHLDTFQAVIRTGSMSKAAALLHLSQPAVSQHIRALEEHFGVELLRRTNRGIEPTPYGELVARYARRLLAIHQTLQQEITDLKAAEQGRILVGASSAIGGYALPCSVYLFRERHPGAWVDLMVAAAGEIVQRLQDDLLRVAVVEGPLGCEEALPADRWARHVLADDHLVLVGPVRGPLARRCPQRCTPDDLRQLPLVVREPGSGSRQALEQGLPAAGLTLADLNVLVQTGSLDAVKTSVEAGHGFALVSSWSVRKEVRNRQMRRIDLDGLQFPVPWTLLHLQESYLTPLERAFVRFLRSPADRGFC